MEFRYPKEEEREQVEFLWSYCFEPKGDPFYEFYFSNCYEPENIIVGVENNTIVADLHLRPYTLSVRGKEMKTSYIVGVATHPAARRGGIGRDLLKASLEELKKRNEGITILMPSKAGFYQQYGWDIYCHQWVRRLPLDDLRYLSDRTVAMEYLSSPDDWTILAPVYEQYTQGLSGYTVRREQEWRRLLGSLFAEGVHVVVARSDEGIAEGYMFYRLGAPEIMVSEMVYTTRRGQKGLLGYLYNHRSQGDSVRWNEGLHDKGYIFYPDGRKGSELMPFMMARVTDVKTAIEEVPVRELDYKVTFTIMVEDSLGTWNEGAYHVTATKGQATVVKLERENVDHTACVTLSVGALALLLLGRLGASELAYEAKLKGPMEIIELLNLLYPDEKTYINEWY